jgi:hypothetical protein
MTIICAWCDKKLGEKPGEGTTHTVCAECERKQNELLEQLKKESVKNENV